jgi:hypothetical protein
VNELVQQDLRDVGIVWERTLAHETHCAQIKADFGDTGCATTIRRQHGDHILQNERVEWLYADSRTAFSQTIENDLIGLDDFLYDVPTEWLRK